MNHMMDIITKRCVDSNCKLDKQLLKPQTCSEAAWSNDLSSLKELRKKGCFWDREVTAAAASLGHLEMLTWAWENGCPIDNYASRYAANYGHVHILQWLKETHNLVDDYLFGWAANYDHFNVCLWCIEQNLNIQPKFYYLQASCRTNFEQFKLVKKLLNYQQKYDVFYDQESMTRWCESVDTLCDDICYKDLSNLIKSYI